MEEREEERQRRSARKRRADENKENEAPLAIAAPQDTARPAKKSRQKPGSPNNLQKTLAILKRPQLRPTLIFAEGNTAVQPSTSAAANAPHGSHPASLEYHWYTFTTQCMSSVSVRVSVFSGSGDSR